MLKVAVTGNAGSGKSIVCNRFRELGISVISTDRLAREVIGVNSPLLKAIAKRFGKQVLNPDGSLDRRNLRRMILCDDTKRHALEQLIHPEILTRMNRKMAVLEKNGVPVVLVEIPLLFEVGLERHFDIIVLVSAGTNLKIERLMARDRISRDEAKALLRTQSPDANKVKHADFVLINNGSLEQMIKESDRLFERLKQKINKIA
jgi:dephospho-CoA kinase